MEIVTGLTEEAHVTPIDDAVRNTNLGYYTDRVVFDTFRAFEAVAVTANEVRVYGGYGMNQGRLFKIDEAEYDSVTIENGSQGVKRADLIVAKYTMDSQTGFEDISLAVIKGQSGNTYTDPTYITGNINEGATEDDFPLYRVKVNGIVIEDVEPLFTPLPTGGRLGLVEKKIDDHIADTENPHNIAWTEAIELTAMSVADTMAVQFGKIAKAITSLIAHITNKNNPHKVSGNQLTSAVPISKGGTGATTAAQALANLGVPSDVASAATKSYVKNKLVDSIESSTTATAHHDIGDFIIYSSDDTLAKVTAEINIGDTIANGTNVINEPIGAELTNMKATFQDGVDTIYDAIVAEGVTPSASTPSACATGIHDITQITWTETLYGTSAGSNPTNFNISMGLPYKNVKKIKNTSDHSITISWRSGGDYNNTTLEINQEMEPPTGATIASSGASYWNASYYPSSASSYTSLTVEVTFQTKILRP